jgi:hypothetical protein
MPYPKIGRIEVINAKKRSYRVITRIGKVMAVK